MQRIAGSKPIIQWLSTAVVTIIFALLMFERYIGFDTFRFSILIFLFSLPFIKYPQIPRAIKRLYIVIIVFLIYCLLITWHSPYAKGFDLIPLDNWIVFLPMFALVSLINITRQKLFFILVIGLLVSLVPATHDLVTGLKRYDGFHGQPIIWGNLSILTGLLAFTLSLFMTKKIKILGALALFIGIFICSVSQTRGGWISLGFITPLLMFLMWKQLNRKALILSAVFGLVGLGFILSSDQLGMSKRFFETIDSANAYFKENNSSTSLGIRFDLWGSAWRAFQENPLFGIAPRGFNEWLKVDDSLRDKQYWNHYGHAHNEFIGWLSSLGLIGSLMIIIIIILMIKELLGPDIKSKKLLKVNRNPETYLAIVLLVSYLGFCLTESFLTSRLGLAYFILMFCLLKSVKIYEFPKANNG